MRVLHARDVYLTGRRSRMQLRPDHCVLGRMMVVQCLGHDRDMSANSAGTLGVTGLDVVNQAGRAGQFAAKRPVDEIHLECVNSHRCTSRHRTPKHVRTLTMPYYPAHASCTRLLDLVTADCLWAGFSVKCGCVGPVKSNMVSSTPARA